jgi:hypothetical protein
MALGRDRASAARSRLGWVAAIGLAIAAACSSTDEEERRIAELAEGCLINTDCVTPLVCAFKRCHVQCSTSRDCEPKQLCVAADKPFFVCQLDDERDCIYNSECPGSQVCGVDGHCRDQCAGDADCVPEQICTQGTCAESWELVDGRLPVSPNKPDGGQPCTYHSQCPDPQVCIAGTCRLECLENRDCSAGLECIGSRCLPPGTPVDGGADGSGQACTYHSDCPPGQICDAGKCRCQCKTAIDCPTGQICDGCGCTTWKPDGAPDGYGLPCALPSDCDSPLVCKAGSCVYECNQNIDCSGGLCCFQHKCVTGSVCTPDGGPPDGGGFEGGAPCVTNNECDDGLWCNGPEWCALGKCAPALDTPCNSHSSCIQDMCAEATKTCSSIVLAAQDADQDTYLDLACGGQDCDDTDPARYPGAPELCDQKDNDCNGKVDDKSVAPQGTKFTGPVSPTILAMQRTSGVAVPKGSGHLAFYSIAASGGVGPIWAEELDATGAVVGTPQQVFSLVSLDLLGADAGGGTVLLLVREIVATTSWNAWFVLLTDSLAPVAQVKLGKIAANHAADVVWTGTDYVIAWPFYVNAGYAEGHVLHVSTSGVISGDAVTPTNPANNSPVFVAASGSSFTALYQTQLGEQHLAIFGASGTLLHGPITIWTSGTPAAVAGTGAGGFVTLGQGMNAIQTATYVDALGQIGPKVQLTFPIPGWADGASNGTGALFAVTGSTYLPTLGYAAADLSTGVELAQALNPPTGTGEVNLAGGPASHVLSHFSGSTLRFTRVGCP